LILYTLSVRDGLPQPLRNLALATIDSSWSHLVRCKPSQAWKLRAVTPQLSPASVVGFSSRSRGGGYGPGDCTPSPSGAGSYDNFDYVAPQTTGELCRYGFQDA